MKKAVPGTRRPRGRSWFGTSSPVSDPRNGVWILRRHLFRQLGQGLAFGGVGPLRRDFSCRDESKGPMGEARVGQFENGTSTNHALTDQKVEVEGAGSPTGLVFSVSPGGSLDLVAQAQEISGRCLDGDHDRGIEVGRLFGSDGCRTVKRGPSTDLKAGVLPQSGHRLLECRPNVADVAAQTNDDFHRPRLPGPAGYKQFDVER